jgi:hypothetical protein
MRLRTRPPSNQSGTRSGVASRVICPRTLLWSKHSMSGLYLIGSSRQPPPRAVVWSLPPYDLDAQPQRPGELCDELRLDDPHLAARVEDLGARAGVPALLWATVAVEASRCVTTAGELLDTPAETLIAWLDEAASHPTPSLETLPVCRLLDYAAALMRATPRRPRARIGPLLLGPSQTMLTAWTLASIQAGLRLDEWALNQLARAPACALSWEASAALSGRTLSEWVVAQAARRLRSASTLAQAIG